MGGLKSADARRGDPAVEVVLEQEKICSPCSVPLKSQTDTAALDIIAITTTSCSVEL
jgi:hypothetical protein